MVERRAAIIQKISEIEAHEERQVLDNLFKTSDNQVLSQSSSSDDASLNSDEEYLQYNKMHEEIDDVTSGYSTYSSSKEEAFLLR